MREYAINTRESFVQFPFLFWVTIGLDKGGDGGENPG
jgi:hypothetical protein